MAATRCSRFSLAAAVFFSPSSFWAMVGCAPLTIWSRGERAVELCPVCGAPRGERAVKSSHTSQAGSSWARTISTLSMSGVYTIRSQKTSPFLTWMLMLPRPQVRLAVPSAPVCTTAAGKMLE